MTIAEKAALCDAMSVGVVRFTWVGIRAAEGEISDERMRWLLTERRYGTELTEQAFGPELNVVSSSPVEMAGGRRPGRFVGVLCESASTEGLGAYLAKIGDAAGGGGRHQMGSELTRSKHGAASAPCLERSMRTSTGTPLRP